MEKKNVVVVKAAEMMKALKIAAAVAKKGVDKTVTMRTAKDVVSITGRAKTMHFTAHVPIIFGDDDARDKEWEITADAAAHIMRSIKPTVNEEGEASEVSICPMPETMLVKDEAMEPEKCDSVVVKASDYGSAVNALIMPNGDHVSVENESFTIGEDAARAIATMAAEETAQLTVSARKNHDGTTGIYVQMQCVNACLFARESKEDAAETSPARTGGSDGGSSDGVRRVGVKRPRFAPA